MFDSAIAASSSPDGDDRRTRVPGVRKESPVATSRFAIRSRVAGPPRLRRGGTPRRSRRPRWTTERGRPGIAIVRGLLQSRRQYILFFALVVAVVTAALVLGKPRQPALLDAVPRDAWLVVTVDVPAVRQSALAKPLLG